jgi:gamma-glutamylcyclotransferase (GGCT)/AIG2-like uncharacterized protein YtfP
VNLHDQIALKLSESADEHAAEALALLQHLSDPTPEQADEQAAAMRFPAAVYGTLRPGFGNDRLWQGKAKHIGDGTVHGYRLVGRGFPYAIPSPDETIVVSLIQPYSDTYDYVLERMDWLEGVPHHYTRVNVAVLTEQGYIVAWMYQPADWIDGPDSTHRSGPAVPTNSLGQFDWALTKGFWS